MKEITMYGAIALVVALFANHYAELNVPFLNTIEDSIVGESDPEGFDEEDSSSVFDYADIDAAPDGDRDCKRTVKIAGDAKMQIRKHLINAKKEHDEDRVSELEDKLLSWQEKIDAVCNKG